MTGTSQTSVIESLLSRFGVDHTDWPTFQKKFTRATDAPVMIAAPRPTRTPNLPRPARCGLDELAPRAQTIAETMTASTARIRPTVIEAPTIPRSWPMPGSPSELGLILISSGIVGGSRKRTVNLLLGRVDVLKVGADAQQPVLPGECGTHE